MKYKLSNSTIDNVLREIKVTLEFSPSSLQQTTIDYGDAIAQLRILVEDALDEVIGDGEMHVGHVCSQDKVFCCQLQAREQMRKVQRHRKAKVLKELFGDE